MGSGRENEEDRKFYEAMRCGFNTPDAIAFVNEYLIPVFKITGMGLGRSKKPEDIPNLSFPDLLDPLFDLYVGKNPKANIQRDYISSVIRSRLTDFKNNFQHTPDVQGLDYWDYSKMKSSIDGWLDEHAQAENGYHTRDLPVASVNEIIQLKVAKRRLDAINSRVREIKKEGRQKLESRRERMQARLPEGTNIQEILQQILADKS